MFNPNNVIKYRNRRSPRNNSIGWGPRLIKRRLLIQILPPLLRGYVKKKKKKYKNIRKLRTPNQPHKPS
jgi:hypothetical protein